METAHTAIAALRKKVHSVKTNKDAMVQRRDEIFRAAQAETAALAANVRGGLEHLKAQLAVKRDAHQQEVATLKSTLTTLEEQHKAEQLEHAQVHSVVACASHMHTYSHCVAGCVSMATQPAKS